MTGRLNDFSRGFLAAAEATGPPVYGLAPKRDMFLTHGGFGGGGSVARVSLMHGWARARVNVTTSNEPLTHPEFSLRFAVQDVLRRLVPWNTAWVPVFPLELSVDRWERHVSVGDGAAMFVLVGTPEVWSGFGEIADRLVTLEGEGCSADGIELTIVDPVAYDNLPNREVPE